MLKIEQHASLVALARAAVATGDMFNVATFSEDADRNQRVAAHLSAARAGVSSRFAMLAAHFREVFCAGADMTADQVGFMLEEMGLINEQRARLAQHRKLACIWHGKNRAAGPQRNLSGSFA